MFNRLLRKGLLATAVSGIGVLAMTMAPASAAAGAAAGVVTGNVALTPGLGGGGTANPLVCTGQTFNFAPITIAGAFVSGTGVGAGTIVTQPVTGRTTGALFGCPAGTENLLSATGQIDGFTLSGGGVGTVTGGCGTVGVQGSAGSYTRIGSIVLVSLGCHATIASPTGNSTTNNLGVTLPAWFQPSNPGENGVTVPFRSAIFAGLFVGAGTN